MREWKMNGSGQRPKPATYWLLIKNTRAGVEILTTGLPDDWRSLAVFSFREEAEMFLSLRGSRDGWRVRETTAGELLSMLHTVLANIRRVALDPIPESSCLVNTRILSISRTEFMERLGMAGGGCEVAGRRRPDFPASRAFQRARKTG